MSAVQGQPITTPTVTITPERWLRLQELFERALPLTAEARAQLLLDECVDDFSLREQVLSLLIASHDDGGELEERVDQAISGAARSRDLPPGEAVGRYKIVRMLGRGGMGCVYLAERADEEYQQSVALKVVEWGPSHRNLSGRFRSERQILARLSHVNIARLLDGGQMRDGVPYLVMEYVDGTRIDHYCNERKLSVTARLKLIQQVCAGVQYAHQNLVVHRDLKPSNILVTEDGVPKLLDFGIAKLVDPRSSATGPVTRLADRVLTPEHASPEQLLGEPVGTASDIYSLGVLLYELLSGKRPYELANLSRVEIERILDTTTPMPPSARVSGAFEGARNLKRDIEGDLDNIVLKAMHRDPQRRYATAGALAQDIQNYLDGRPVQARPDTWAYRTRKFLRRNGWEVAGITASILMICVVVVFYTLRLEQERDAAQIDRKTADSVSDFMIDVFRRANPAETQGETVTVRDALDAAAARIDRDLTDQPRLRLSLMRKMGQSYSGLGLMSESRALAERSVALARSEFGDGDVEVARTLESLGHVLFSTSKYEDAGKVFAEAESIRAKLGLTHDAEWVRLMHSIGTNLRQQQRFEEAIAYQLRAEQYGRALVPPDPGTLGNVLQGLATTYVESGDYAAGERYAREALPMLRGVVYEGNDLYANALNALSMILRRQYKLEESEATFREFIEYQVKVLGPDHWLLGRARNNFAGMLRLKGDYAAAEKELLEALRTFRLRRTPDQFDLAITHHNLGANYREAGDPVRALEYLDLALGFKRATTGPRSPQMVSTLLEKSATLREMGDLTGAIAAMSEAQSIAREKFDATDRRHALVTAERGRLNLVAGKYVEAERDLRDAVQQLRGQEEPARLADALVALAQVVNVTGNKETARTLLSEAVTLRRKIMPPAHPAIASALRAIDAIDQAAPVASR